jgi:hypothetical protein
MTGNESLTNIEAAIHQLDNESNDACIQKADVLLKKIELLIKLEDLKSKERNKRVLTIISNPLIITIIAGLLTSLIAPYIIERTREKIRTPSTSCTEARRNYKDSV